MKQQSNQKILFIFIWLLIVLQPLLAKEPVKSKETDKGVSAGLVNDPGASDILITRTGENSVRLLDNFNFDSLQKTTNYVEWLDDGFKVQDGLLKTALSSRQKAYLQILPSFGNEFEFSIDVQYDGEPLTDASFTLLINRDANPLVAAAGIKIDLGQSRVSGWYMRENQQAGKEYIFEPRKWYTCKVVAANGLLGLFINNSEVFKMPLSATEESMTSPADEGEDEEALLAEEEKEESSVAESTPFTVPVETDKAFANAVNFSLLAEGGAEKNAISFDNLMITGKAAPATAYLKTIKSRFLLGKKEHQLAVLYAPGSEQWAANKLTNSIKYLQTIYDTIYQLYPCYPNLGIIQIREGSNFQTGGNFQTIKATYDDAIAGLPTALPDKESIQGNEKASLKTEDSPDPNTRRALLHFWSGYYAEAWMKESIPYLILNIQDALDNKLVTLKDVHQQHQHPGNLNNLSQQFINTFIETPLSSPTAIGLWKAHIFWYLIYKSIGLEEWQKIHKGLGLGAESLASSQLKERLENIKGASQANLFTGWLAPGKGKFDLADALLDTDQDGLFNLDEQLYGTNPLKADSDGDNYPDLSEIQAGYNPTDKKEPEQGVILIDGDFMDWSSTYVFDVDATEDGGKYDLYTLKYVWDRTNGLFFLKINFFKPLFQAAAKRENYYTQVQFDTNNDQETDYRVIFWTGSADAQDWVGIYQYEKDTAVGSSKQKKQIELKEGEVICKAGDDCLELCVPLGFMNMAKSSFFGITVDGGQETQLDRFDTGWIKIIPVLPYAPRPKKVWTPGLPRKASPAAK